MPAAQGFCPHSDGCSHARPGRIPDGRLIRQRKKVEHTPIISLPHQYMTPRRMLSRGIAWERWTTSSRRFAGRVADQVSVFVELSKKPSRSNARPSACEIEAEQFKRKLLNQLAAGKPNQTQSVFPPFHRSPGGCRLRRLFQTMESELEKALRLQRGGVENEAVP